MAERKKTSIGGQALIEGVMMRGPKVTAMAVRLPDGGVDVEQWETAPVTAWYKRTPIIRGVFNFIDSMIVGYRCLSKSVDKAFPEDDDEPQSKLDEFLSKKLGEHSTMVITGVAMVLGLALAFGLFAFLPSFLVGLLRPVLPAVWMLTVLEGLVKIAVFVIYLWFMTLLPDMRRLFGYHGAEHKTIACYEAGEALTVENIRKHTRFHPRCGTSFLLIVLIVSILVFSMVSWDNVMVRVVLKVVLLPVVMGVSYEILKLAGRYTNLLTKIVSAPGLWLQRLSTREPDDSMIEVAIASMEPAIPQDQNTDQW